ncbi:Na(+)/H(+) antiporter subunit G [Microbulbifer aggregans]|uniref:Na(+)/H(+) antiporter subunit G n=1 Tax=Microbulbifer aggregans TaxID=1769779 RepID=A0A1C9W9R4_9GAMM|nr:monovalent cation/H(+) antiporter subunit G [Microbulbifer aggregans]AOS97902.1 Na(+)/H(+) antiporter subunit G [Microbulbifer aggregans]
MIDSLISLLAAVMLAAGSFFMVSGAVGLLRFPDFYSRMHAASMTDTLGSYLIIGGLMLSVGWGLPLFKLALILVFIFFTSPTAGHALAKSAQHCELRLSSGTTTEEKAGSEYGDVTQGPDSRDLVSADRV